MNAVINKLAPAFVLSCVMSTSFAENVTLRFSWWGASERHEATLKAIKLFEEKNPGVTIKGEIAAFDGYVEKLAVQMTGRVEPDVMQINWAWVSQFSRDGDGFYDLKKSKEMKLDEFINESWKTGVVKGKLNAVPTAFTAKIFLWNKTMWDKAGIPIPKTWDDLFAAGKQFEAKLGKDYYPLDGQLYDALQLSQAYMLQKTGKSWLDPVSPKVAYTEKEALEWIKFYKKLESEHVTVPLKYRNSHGGGNPETPLEQLPDWVNGKIAGTYVWDSTLKPRTGTSPKTTEFVVGDFLTMKGAKNSGYFGRPSMMLAVSKNSKNPEIAAKFVNWMVNSPEAAKILGTVRGASMSKSFRAEQVNANKFSSIELAAMKQIDAAKVDVPSPYAEYNRIRSWVRDVFEKAAMGSITDEEAAGMLVGESNAQLRRVK